MPLIDITNPKVIAFLVENYEKENRHRINWVQNHREELEKAATLNREPTNYYDTDVIAHSMVAGMAAIARDHEISSRNRRKPAIRDATFIPGVDHLRKGHSIVDLGLGDPQEDPKLSRSNTDLSRDPVMRPVEPKLKEVIYKPRPYGGRVQYLEKRSKMWPEKKYYFAECSNWDYGWRTGDSKMRQKREFGRCWHLTKGLRTRVGPQPDPKHYRPSAIPGPSKCGF